VKGNLPRNVQKPDAAFLVAKADAAWNGRGTFAKV